MNMNEYINNRRKELNMSLDELVEKSGIPKGTVSKITAGINKNPKLSTLQSLCDALDCTLDDLIYAENQDKKIALAETKDEDTEKIIKNYHILNPRGRKKLVEYSEDLVCSGNYADTVIVSVAARTSDNRKSVKTQITQEELSIFDITPQSDGKL